jgi:hypothetical protein
MTTIINLTPHAMHIYPENTPDRIDPASVEPTCIITPSTDHVPARLGQIALGDDDAEIGIPVERVAFGLADGQVEALPEPTEGTWYLVSLVVGLAASNRHDLLVPYAYIRDLNGSIIGSRKLARPVCVA